MAKVRYNHGFRWDLFISYSHDDNAAPENWVEAFEARLNVRLKEIGGNAIEIWRDARRMGPGAVLEPAVMEAVKDSAIFLLILSPSWKASDWCPREREVFESTGYRLAVANRSRLLVAERYPADPYPTGVMETLITRFFGRKTDGSPQHFVVPKEPTAGADFEDPFVRLAGSIVETLRELERNPVRRPGPQEGRVWFAPVANNPDLQAKLKQLENQVRQLGFGVAADPEDSNVNVRLVGPNEARESEVSPNQLVFVDPKAAEHKDGLAAQMTRDQAGRDGVEVLTDWTELQERLQFRLQDTQALEQILIGKMMEIAGEANQIFRPVTMFDHGIDGELEFKDDTGKATGKRVYIQLKSGNSYLRTRKSDGREIFDIPHERHLEYWVSQPVDVYLVIRQTDRASGQQSIRWMNVTHYLKARSDKQSRQIVFEGQTLDARAIRTVRDEILREGSATGHQPDDVQQQPQRPGAQVYLVHESPDEARAVELSGHISAAGCVVQTQGPVSARQRNEQNKFWMGQCDGVLVVLGNCSPDWRAIHLRHLVQYAPEGKHKGLFLDAPEDGEKKILRKRPDLQILDGIEKSDRAQLIGQFVTKLPERGTK